MSLPRTQFGYSIDEYLAIDRASEERYEYLDGAIYAMAGESPAHGIICTNLTGLLYLHLRDGPCHLFSKDTKVRSGPDPKPGRKKGLFSYPDVVVVCEEMKFHDQHQDILLNPNIIIEVMSPNTREFDHGDKQTRYQAWLPSLAEYILVSQDTPRVEMYTRANQGEWIYSVAEGLESEIHITSIDCTLRLSQIYARVVFPETKPESADESFEDILRRKGLR